MFKNLVGSDSLQNVLIVTTMWGSVEKVVCERREEELRSRDTLFKPLIDAGARVFRHDLGSESAKRIIDTLLGKTPKELLIQTELSNGVSLAETSAGAELSADLDHFAERDRKKLRDLEQELNDAIQDEDMELVTELKKELAKLKRRIKTREEDKEKLTTTYGTRGMGHVMGALVEHHAVEMKREGSVVGVVGGMTVRRVIAKTACVGVPEETEIATRISSLVNITERQRRKCGARGKYFRTLRALAGVAMGTAAALAVNASARAWVWNIL
jgi:cyanophycinase-like exopeptidase